MTAAFWSRFKSFLLSRTYGSPGVFGGCLRQCGGCGVLGTLSSASMRSRVLDGIHLDAGAHGGGHHDRPQVLALGRARLGADELLDDGLVVLEQLASPRRTSCRGSCARSRCGRCGTRPCRPWTPRRPCVTSIVTVPTDSSWTSHPADRGYSPGDRQPASSPRRRWRRRSRWSPWAALPWWRGLRRQRCRRHSLLGLARLVAPWRRQRS